MPSAESSDGSCSGIRRSTTRPLPIRKDGAQPIQWSSEYSEEELGLVYYNYRHLNPHDGRWVSRDPIMEQGGWNLFAFVNNNGMINFDYLGEKTIPKDTPIITITVKRKTIKWKQLVRENVFKKLEGEEEDAYGHWWVELGNESYGWWPAKGVDLLSTLTGVPGYLNGIFFSTFMRYGKEKEKNVVM